MALVFLLLSACSPSPSVGPAADLSTALVTLPDGHQVRAELAVSPEEHARGLMFRSELPPGRGMLFIFPNPQRRPFWMYQTLIPLDIIWLDENRRVVEISAHTPPCPAENAQDCPSYGGNASAKYVLEIAAGQASEHGVEIGVEIRF